VVRQFNGIECADVAATRPAWRVLKVLSHIDSVPGLLGCSDSTRMEGTESVHW